MIFNHIPRSLLVPGLMGLVFISIWLCRPLNADAHTESLEKEILSIGTGKIFKGNLAGAKEAAIGDALKKGVERDLERRLGRQGMVDSFASIVHDILPGAKDAIVNFNILAEDQAGDQYTVLVRLKVNDKLMEERLRGLGALAVKGSPIRVLFLVSHIEPQKNRALYWWGDPRSDAPLSPTELVLYRIFEEYGFSPINRMLNIPEKQFSDEMKALELPFAEAVRWGGVLSANVVVLGRCEVMEGQSVSVNLTAVDSKTSTVLGRESRIERIDGGSSDPGRENDPVTRAISKAVAELSPLIFENFESTDREISQFEMTLEGLKSLGQFREFKAFLQNEIPGVKAVTQTRIKGKSLTVRIDFSGEKEHFLDMVSGYERLPFQAEMTTSEAGEILFNIR